MLLIAVTIGYIPLVLPLLLEEVLVHPAKIARSLVLLMLLPLAVGLAMKARYETAAARVKPVLDRVSGGSLMTGLILVANFGKVLDIFGTRGILGGILFIVLGLGMLLLDLFGILHRRIGPCRLPLPRTIMAARGRKPAS